MALEEARTIFRDMKSINPLVLGCTNGSSLVSRRAGVKILSKMTNEEKINLRERAWKLAEKQVALNMQTWSENEVIRSKAEAIYLFLLWGSEISEPKKSRDEIDWSYPQLVVSKYDDTMIVRTTGLNGFDEFEGFSDEDGDTPGWYKKKRFKHYGEIQEGPSNDNEWTESEFMEWIYERMKHVHGENEYVDYMIRFRSIIDKNKKTEWQKEENTTGLNFLEAIHACKSGKNIRRSDWTAGFLYHSNDFIYDADGDIANFHLSDILATDWQIVK